MSEQLLQVRNLSVSVEDKPILHGIDLEVRPGETHVLMGPNGAGKSTLGYTIMGSPRYEVTGGEILFKGKELLEETTDQRAKDGIFLSFQNPLEVPGVSLRNFSRGTEEWFPYQAVDLQKGAGAGYGGITDGSFLRGP